MAADGEYGTLLNEAGKLALSADGEKKAVFFRAALNAQRRVLDVGCGPGFPLVVLAECVTMSCGVDASPAMLDLARQNVSALRIKNAVLVRGMVESLPFADSAFDGFAVCGTLGSVPEPAAVLSELARVATSGAVVASVEQDFRARLGGGTPREFRWLRQDGGALTLQIVRYMACPYRIRDERYTLNAASDFCQRLLANLELSQTKPTATDLSPEDLPPECILDASYEEEAQFDPVTLREAFERAGFEVVKQRLVVSYNRPHIFSISRRA